MNFPVELKYTKDHEWLRVEGNTAYVGITSFAQSELGDIVYVDVDTEEEMLGYGIGIILLNIGMYFVAPAAAIIVIKNRIKHN